LILNTATSWDPTIAGQRICLRDNPSRQGLTTGETLKSGGFLMVEVDFGPAERQFKNYALLELVHASANVLDLLLEGRFADPAALRRVLTYEKVKGDLTNIFYSMESSNTDFYPHQFKPVMTFIESPVGRMLIADEVGLGKTIEAIYIWKELQARQDARRLLIVCPAMLREKWRNDLKHRFNIRGEIITPQDLLQRLTEIAAEKAEDAFTYIVSLESIRTPVEFEDEGTGSVRARLARILVSQPASEAFALFDLVVMDEAHYLRNPATANHRTAVLLQEAARHLVLLTATPIQLNSDNLYQLLRLIDPDQFYDTQLFAQMLGANAHIVKAQRALWRQPPAPMEAKAAIDEALQADYFRADPVLAQAPALLAAGPLSDAKRIELLRTLESRSLLSLYMSRSRKREVLEKRVARAAQSPALLFNPAELALYQHVSRRVRDMAQGKIGFALFPLISRQRQMASSLVGALESWDEKGIADELVWEDFGRSVELETGDGDASLDDAAQSAPAYGAQFDIAELERTDSKYLLLREVLQRELAANPAEKFVVFAFFRGTLKYLHRRLAADGIHSTLLMGNLGDEKDTVIADFAKTSGPSVLLSSEVGSEGLDLQFCRFLVNYDLPWNPMKVEQRIGRLDRLGQKAERISIINFAVQNTIEDRIVMRLYDRINVFRESIGDLEDILGPVTDQLVIELLDPNLSDAEKEERAAQTTLALENRRQEQEKLEQEAVNLVGFSDFILDSIRGSRDKGRWLSATELIAFVEDFFLVQYQGTTIAPHEHQGARLISLSEEARGSLAHFIAQHNPASRTRLHRTAEPIACLFDPHGVGETARSVELIEPAHPLIQWIREHYAHEHGALFQVSALTAPAAALEMPAGDYVYCIHRWSLQGLKSEHTLAFSAALVSGGTPLSETDAEEFVFRASKLGRALPNARNLVADGAILHAAASACDQALGERWAERAEAFNAENEMRCRQQELSARKYADRRISELTQRIARYEQGGKQRQIPMTRGLLTQKRDELAQKLRRIESARIVDPTLALIAAGVIRLN
jgi:SNF2 family DNA or RNA helicase